MTSVDEVNEAKKRTIDLEILLENEERSFRLKFPLLEDSDSHEGLTAGKIKDTDEPWWSAVKVMREKNEFTDVVLVCNGGEVAVHQNVLAARSPYFRKMFLNNFKESTTKQVDFSHISKDTMLLIVDYIYLNLMENISDQNNESLINIFQISHLFEIEGLMKSCWKLILNQINAENWFTIWELVLLHGNNEDIVKLLHFILDNISEIVERNCFLLNYSQLMTMLKKINENNLPMEEKFLEAIIQWKKNKRGETVDFQTVFLEINLNFISREFMNNLLENEKDLFEETFHEVWKRRVLPTLKTYSEIQTHKITFSPEQTAETIVSQQFFIFSCYRKEANECFLYGNTGLRIIDCEKRSLTIFDKLPFRFGRGIFPIQCGSDIYIIGGILSGVAEPVASKKTKSFFLYDWKNNEVIVKPSLLEEVSNPVTCVIENNIYAFDYIENKMTIQYFSLLDQKWLAKTYTGFYPVACARVKNVTYLLCSRDGNSGYYYLYTVDQLNCTFHSNTPVPVSWTDRWAIVRHTHIDRNRLTVYRDKIFLLYGDSVHQWYTFDPDSKLWTNEKASCFRKHYIYNPCFFDNNNSLMLYHSNEHFYMSDEHSIYKFGANIADIKKIMSFKISFELDENLQDLSYQNCTSFLIFQP